MLNIIRVLRPLLGCFWNGFCFYLSLFSRAVPDNFEANLQQPP